MIDPRVDLPAPFGPSTQQTCPAAIDIETPSRARRAP